MSIFDVLENAAADLNVPAIDSLANMAHSATSLIMPPELANMQNSHDKILERCNAVAQGQSPASDLTYIRTSLSELYTHLHDGGEPKPNTATALRIKAMPQYHKLVEDYANLNTAVAALESQFLKCTFGYQMADGSIVIPDIHWTDEQLAQVTSQALHQTGRCWLDADRSQFV